ncbi:MAG: FG-GAP repeat protein, partial [Dehalococcoidia bacterium]|nr:FG-GAP repeat protein [Dehalococcoidia bacterium]
EGFATEGLNGAAHVFTRDSETGRWRHVARLTASDGEHSDQLGHSVSIDGDTVAVGAWLDSTGDDIFHGSVYVFTKPANGWADATETAKLTASDGDVLDHLGISVAVDGDTVVAGSNGRALDPSATQPIHNAGTVYVFVKPTTGWADANETALLTASDGERSDELGYSVSIDGDTVVAGAWKDDVSGDDKGSAYVFVKPVGGWADASETAKLTALDGGDGDKLGRSVAVDGDTVVVGASGDDDEGSNSGSVYVYTKPATGWADATENTKLTASDGASGDILGSSVAVDGDTVVAGKAAIPARSTCSLKTPTAGARSLRSRPRTERQIITWGDL